MLICTNAWNVFIEWKDRVRNQGERPDGLAMDIYSQALEHIRCCPLCIIKFADFTRVRPIHEDAWNGILPFIAEAAGISIKEISPDTVLRPLQIANVMIMLYRIKRCRIRCFTDRMTIGELVLLWASPLLQRRL